MIELGVSTRLSLLQILFKIYHIAEYIASNHLLNLFQPLVFFAMYVCIEYHFEVFLSQSVILAA